MSPAEIARMFSSISARYDLANHILSLQLDRAWRKRLVRWADPRPQARILDVCTGTGDLLLEFHRRQRQLSLWGLDLSREMLVIAQKKLQPMDCAGSHCWIEGDTLELPFASESLDMVTIAFGLRNLPDIQAGLAEMVRVLKPGGRLLLLEFALPANRLWRAAYLLYLKRVVPRLGALITGSRYAYEYLCRSICEFPSPQEILNQLELAGLTLTESLSLTGGIAVIYRGDKQEAQLF